MSNLQKTLDALQPYVIGIRYLDGMPVVDAVFKDDWSLPESNFITKVKGNNDVNYYMLFSETEGIGLDELLSYVDVTIKTNIEKEKKHELLKERVNELKELFKRTPLTKLQRLKFLFSEEDLVPSINELDINEEEKINVNLENLTIETEVKKIAEDTFEEMPMTDEEREILEEEKRAKIIRNINRIKKILLS